jgi:hypothetical protein
MDGVRRNSSHQEIGSHATSDDKTHMALGASFDSGSFSRLTTSPEWWKLLSVGIDKSLVLSADAAVPGVKGSE